MSSVRARLFQTETFRLAAVFAGLFLAAMALLMILTFAIVSDAFEANLLRDSRDDLAAIRKAYATAAPGRSLHEAKEMIDDRLLATDAADLFLLQASAHRVAGNLPVMGPRAGVLYLPFPAAQGRNAEAGHTILGQGEMIDRGVYAFVGRDLYAAKAAEEEVLGAFAFVLAAGLALAVAGGMLVSRTFVRRIDAIAATCRGIMAGRLGERIPVRDARNELDQLAASINAMLDRIAALMESLRQVSNDIAHDLRTPLARLRYGLERARHGARTTGEYAAAVDGAILECDQLLAMFAAMLRIAQIEAGVRQSGMEELDLTEVLQKLVGLYEPVMDDTGHPFETRLEHGLRLRGDPQLLFRLFANLLDNAIHHTPSGARIRLTADPGPGRARVAVSDEGPGIPPEDRQKVFRRFFRREQSRTTPGSGLGLALAAAIAELHDAQISLEDNAPGLQAVVEFS